MTKIKKELQELVSQRMLPEVESYIEDLHKLLANNTASEDDINVIKDMESFMVELQNIIEAIQTDMISDVQAKEVYENMIELIEESETV